MRIVNSQNSTFPLLKNVKKSYVIRSYITSDGERFSQLCEDGERFPLFYPTAYCSRCLRQRNTHSTQKDHLYAIKKLYTWAESRNIDIHKRLATHRFFNASELDSLTDWVSLKKSSSNGEAIVGNKINSYLSFISRYLTWYAEEIITDANRPEIRNNIDRLEAALKTRHVKQGSQSKKTQHILGKKISDEMRSSLELIFSSPLSSANKKSDQGPAYRNALALRILYDTGMRVGELLSLTLGDFNLATGGAIGMLEIRINHNDPFDDRVRQPVAKTVGRFVPISAELEEMISIYLKKWRSIVPGVGFNDHDFILITHRKGKRQGRSLQYTSFESCINTLKKKHSNLKGLHPHLLRHDWNYRLSIQASKLNYTSTKERAARELLMGWQPGSSTSAHYNRRHVQESAFQVGLQVASHVGSRR